MGKVTGFMEYERVEEGYEPGQKRVKNYNEVVIGLKEDEAKIQTARCMDCGTPFCNNGCPVNNIIPDFNDLVYRGDWKNAIEVLHSTTIPRVHGRICPRRVKRLHLNVNDERWASRASSTPSSTAPGPKAGCSRACPSARRARRLLWWALARRAWRRPSSSHVLATT